MFQYLKNLLLNNKSFIKIVLCFAVIVLLLPHNVQSKTIQIIDAETKEPLIGANVMYICTSSYCEKDTLYLSANLRGEINVPKIQGIYKVSYVGYEKLIKEINEDHKGGIELIPSSIRFSEIVTTGQHSPVLAKNSLYQVDVISNKVIESRGASNLRDLLKDQASINITQDAALGSRISINGVGGENVKILIDGVPVIGRTNGNINLEQLNIENVDRVEIVKGAMSTIYGSDALGGVINLITKNEISDNIKFSSDGLYESVGRYNFNLNGVGNIVGNNINIHFGRNFFGGFSLVDDGSRSFDWKPQEQYYADLNLTREIEGYNIRYTGRYFQELMLNRGNLLAPYFEKAFDSEFHTTRLTNQISINKEFYENNSFNLQVAYSNFDRVKNTYLKDLVNMTQTFAGTDEDQDTSVFNSWMIRSWYSDNLFDKSLNYQIGIDFNLDDAGGGRILEDSFIGDYGVFLSTEYKISDGIQIQPAIRYIYNTKYDAPLVPTLNFKADLSDELMIRASYANGFRSPSLRELYLFFVDPSHNIRGNQDLTAERADNYMLSISYTTVNERRLLSIEPNLFFNDIRNKIDLANVEGDLFSYVNIAEFQSLGGGISLKYMYDDFFNKVTFNYIGRRNSISKSVDETMFTPELMINSSYEIKDLGLNINLFYKFTGDALSFFLDANNEVQRLTINSFHSLDFTLSKSFADNFINLVFGVKNLFDVTDLQTSVSGGGSFGGVHSGGGNTVPMAYGRTFFVNTKINL